MPTTKYIYIYISMRKNERGSPKSSSLLAVYNVVGVVDLLNTHVAFRRLDRWALVTLNNLLREIAR